MKRQTKFELLRWTHFVILFLVAIGVMFFVAELLIGPLLRWLFHNIPYALPTWNRIGRIALAVMLSGVICGTLAWYYERRQSGR